jgi:hypothetical protein
VRDRTGRHGRAAFWLRPKAALRFGVVLFSLPELAVALFDEWPARMVGLTVCLEFGGKEPAPYGSGMTSDLVGAQAQ